MKKEKNEGKEARASRRRFTKTLAAAALAAPAALAARAQTPPKAAEPKAPPNPQPTPSPSPQQTQGPPKPSPVAEAYGEVARLRFGAHLSDEQLQAVKRDLEGNVRTAERLRAFKLQNSDEPDFAFEA
jgi:glucose/arabinose dehydrogenase